MEDVENTRELDRSKEGIIKAFFDYDPDTGEVAWKDWVSPGWYKQEWSYNKFMQEKAGNLVNFYEHNSGYLFSSTPDQQTVYAHQIVWVLNYGKMPDCQIDHIDGNPKNNSVENLRDVPNKINQRNRKKAKNNSSGVTGVSWNKRAKKWKASIMFDGKESYLGYYNTIGEASQARQKFIEDNDHIGFTKRHGDV